MRRPSRPSESTWRRARHRVAHSIKLRLVLLFLLLAASMTFVFVFGAQRAFSAHWREAARPLLMDYVDHLAEQVTGGGPSPDLARARALTERLPLTVQIDGPQLHWSSHPGSPPATWTGRIDRSDTVHATLSRQTADGHTISFGLNAEALERRPRLLGLALAALLGLTLLAWLYVRHLLQPLDAIGDGARRFGSGDFNQPIPERCGHRPDELGELAHTINTMGQDIHRMLDAKRALLLAISHELRSPLTRARLHAELLPDDADTRPQREALLGNLQEMAHLISDLLESERLAGRHAALQREPTDLAELARSVLSELQARHPEAQRVQLQVDPALPPVNVDPARLRLLLRNLLDNALRHGGAAAQPPELQLSLSDQRLLLRLRDHGPGVPPEQLDRLAEPFYRPDAARARSAGGVGLGLHLCRLVAQAHGGELRLSPPATGSGLLVELNLPTSN